MIKELRTKAGITQEGLAAKLNISSSTLRKWEREGISPALTVKEWWVFCNEVNVKFEDLPRYFLPLQTP